MASPYLLIKRTGWIDGWRGLGNTWQGNSLVPGQHTAGEVLYVGEAGCFKDHAGLPAAIAAAAIANDLFVLPVIDGFSVHHSDLSKRQQHAANIKLRMLRRLTPVNEMERLPGVEPGP